MIEYIHEVGESMKIQRIQVKNYLSKSSLPGYEFTINPYIGCIHGCRYCYASYMKKYTNHPEPWGKFIDIKYCDTKIDSKKVAGKRIFMASVTDCYNVYEGRYRITRAILEQLVELDISLTITTKSKLIVRDIDLLKKCKDVTVAISINTLDEQFKKDMDHASSIKERIETLKILHTNGIKTVVFLSPIFPEITDCKAIMEKTKAFVDAYWLEDLNLRGPYKKDILQYIQRNYPQYYQTYRSIYDHQEYRYFTKVWKEAKQYADVQHLNIYNYLHHPVDK